MAYLDQPINAADLPEDTGGDYSPLPPGEYQTTIKDAELKATNDGTGQYIKLRLDVTGPTHAGRVVFSNINIRNKSSAAEGIGRAQLGAIMKAIGLATLQDTDQLIGGQLTVKLAIREARTDEKTGKTYEASNEVKAYKPIEGAMPSAAAPAMPKPAAAAPAKAAPPWAKK
jgi:hypothetical protein